MHPKIARALIDLARQTPYEHIEDYMERYWLVPYSRETSTTGRKIIGGGKLKFRKHPIGRLLQWFGYAARIHVIKRSDRADAFHDHPWPYCSIILKGWYAEEIPVLDRQGNVIDRESEYFGEGSVLIRPAHHFHRLQAWSGQPATTLFITGKQVNEWGFVPAAGGNIHNKVPAREFIDGTD